MVNEVNGIIKTLNDLKKLGIRSCAIIRCPDYSGGHWDELQFSRNSEEDWYEGLEPFHYVEWEGSIEDLYREWPEMTGHREPFHEKPYDYDINLYDKIKEGLSWWYKYLC